MLGFSGTSGRRNAVRTLRSSGSIRHQDLAGDLSLRTRESGHSELERDGFAAAKKTDVRSTESRRPSGYSYAEQQGEDIRNDPGRGRPSSFQILPDLTKRL